MQDQNTASLGIDVSKRSFDACLISSEHAKPKRAHFQNSPEGFQKLVSWIHLQTAQSVHACMEATSWYAEPLATYLHFQDMLVSIVNPARTSAFAKTKLSRQKTDKTDAFLIAEFCRLHQPAPWVPRTPELAELRAEYRFHSALKMQAAHIKAKINDASPYTPKPILKALRAQYSLLCKQARDGMMRMMNLITKEESLRHNLHLITDIKGIGILTAICILAEIPPVQCFRNVRQYVAHVGLNTRHYASGTSVYKSTVISKIGSARVRKALYMPAIVVKNYNPYFSPFCQTLKARGKKEKQIVIAVARKLLHAIF